MKPDADRRDGSLSVEPVTPPATLVRKRPQLRLPTPQLPTALIALALTYAGHTWGLGKLWAKLPFVQRNRWLI